MRIYSKHIVLQHIKLHLISTILLIYFIGFSEASANTKLSKIYIVIAEKNTTTEQYIQELNQTKVQEFYPVQLKSLPKSLCDTKDCLYIAVGYKVFTTLFKQLNSAPILSVLTSSVTYQQILDKLNANKKKKNHHISAIYADPSINYQLDLIKNIYKEQIKIGFIYSDKSIKALESLETEVQNYPFYSLIKYKLEASESIGNALDAISKADVLLTTPDNIVYNSNTFRHIILTTYRRRQAIIGFSRSFVKSGALATSYSDISHIAKETATAISYYRLRNMLPNPYHSRNHGIIFNNAVANSLNITIREKDFSTDDINIINGTQYVESN